MFQNPICNKACCIIARTLSKEWSWRKNYRVWEANRRVFLYPENYIYPELRDNKSPQFKELEPVGVGEERLILTDGLALVVENRPAAAHPAWADIVPRQLRLAIRAHNDLPFRITLRNRSRLDLDLFLDFTAEAVRVGEAVLDFRLLTDR